MKEDAEIRDHLSWWKDKIENLENSNHDAQTQILNDSLRIGELERLVAQAFNAGILLGLDGVDIDEVGAHFRKFIAKQKASTKQHITNLTKGI